MTQDPGHHVEREKVVPQNTLASREVVGPIAEMVRGMIGAVDGQQAKGGFAFTTQGGRGPLGAIIYPHNTDLVDVPPNTRHVPDRTGKTYVLHQATAADIDGDGDPLKTWFAYSFTTDDALRVRVLQMGSAESSPRAAIEALAIDSETVEAVVEPGDQDVGSTALVGTVLRSPDDLSATAPNPDGELGTVRDENRLLGFFERGPELLGFIGESL